MLLAYYHYVAFFVFIITSLPCIYCTRSSIPSHDPEGIRTGTLFFNITSTSNTIVTQGLQIPFIPTFVGGALPLSNRSDFTIDVNIMLPNINDDISGCQGEADKLNKIKLCGI